MAAKNNGKDTYSLRDSACFSRMIAKDANAPSGLFRLLPNFCGNIKKLI